MKRTVVLATVALFVATAASVGHAKDPAGSGAYEPDNTGRNVRDRDARSKTAGQQSNDRSDVRVTQAIRRAVTSDRNLSTDAHNIKIITDDGVVTLRGPVKTPEERARIQSKAEKVAGVKRVENQLEVTRR